MNEDKMVPYQPRFEPDQSPEEAAKAFYDTMRLRRSVRMFSDKPVSKETIEWVVQAATTAPNGANKQPWRFVCVSNPEMKHKIRLAVEEEERSFYDQRISDRWRNDLKPLQTDHQKGYLETVPWLIVVLKLVKDDDGSQVYYTNESLGIATGMLLAAAHHAGLATLTHTPSPMGFLAKLLDRPEHERPFLLIPVGYPAEDCLVPEHAIARKPLDQVMVTHE